MNEISISKLDASKRQLETAIRLFFCDGEPVSVHTLSAAAYNILKALNKKKSGSPMIVKELIFEMVKPEHKSSVISKMNESENFFKHADRDPDKTLDFNPEMTQFFLLDACSKFIEFSGYVPPLIRVYNIWFMLKYPHCFNLPDNYQQILNSINLDINALPKQEYFNMVLPLVHNI